MSKHDAYGGIENYREELKFDYKVRQTCETCNIESHILTRYFYIVKEDKLIPKDSSWLCTSCFKRRDS